MQERIILLTDTYSGIQLSFEHYNTQLGIVDIQLNTTTRL
jgi:hypothetical protein